MGRFNDQMRCTCSGRVFSTHPIVYTKEGNVNHFKTPDKVLCCLSCGKAYIHEVGATTICAISQETGKKLVRSMVSRNESDEEVVKKFLESEPEPKATKKKSKVVKNG